MFINRHPGLNPLFSPVFCRILLWARFVFLFLVAAVGRADEPTGPALFFTCTNKVYRLQTDQGLVDPVIIRPGLLSMDWACVQPFFYVKEATGRGRCELLRIHTATLHIEKILSGQFSTLIPAPPAVLAFSDIFTEDKGFAWSLFALEPGLQKEQAIRSGSPAEKKRGYLDLFISDYEITSHGFILSGTDKANRYNAIYSLDFHNPEPRLLYKQLKKNDFIKLIFTGENLYFYSSAQNYTAKNDEAPLMLGSLPYKNGTFTMDQIRKSRLAIQQQAVFFGKGFAAGDTLYLPLIDKQNQIFLLKISTTDHEKALMPAGVWSLPSGLYRKIVIKPPRAYFIGFNYYKRSDGFSLLILNLKTGQTESKKLP